MHIAVVALGKIGLPLAVQFATAGHQVVGVDVNAEVVNSTNSGVPHFPGEAHLPERLATQVQSGSLRATTDYAEAIPTADVVVVVVPLVVDEQTSLPDFTWMDIATASIAEYLTADTLISYETTLPVGTTRNRFTPALESGSGLTEGADFYVAFSPERVFSGRIFADLAKYPKIIGAMSAEGTKRAREFYEAVLQFDPREDLPRPNGVWDLGTPEAAEMAKLAETTYRDVNIGLANQFALYAAANDIDVHAVIEACNTQPFSHIHKPGIAVGGHCIPVYPRLYLSTDPNADIVSTARAANAAMPEYMVGEGERILGSFQGLHAVVLGASYRGGVKETAFSGVFPTVEALRARGAIVTVHDPMFTAQELQRLGLDAHTLGNPVDVAVLHTDHAEYREVLPTDFPGIQLLIDGRNATSAERWAGTPRIVVGAPTTDIA